MFGWKTHTYWNVPATANVMVVDAPAAVSPQSGPPTTVTLCRTLSLFVQVTAEPAATLTAGGAKARFVISTGMPSVLSDEQTATLDGCAAGADTATGDAAAGDPDGALAPAHPAMTSIAMTLAVATDKRGLERLPSITKP
jgi:hypothetical protein